MARKPLARRVTIGVLLFLLAGFGCNPIMLPFQLINHGRSRVPSMFDFYEKAKTAKKKKEIKVVILPSRGTRLSADYITTENVLADRFVAALEAGFAENRERVKIVPLRDVEKFKREHDDWKGMDASEIGKVFGADYVIDIELAELSLYEPGTRNLFRGHCSIPITIRDVDPDGTAKFPEFTYTADYPTGGASVPADLDTNVSKFQYQFFGKIATEMTGLFTATSAGSRFHD